jgi:hypothetical protein
MGKVVIELSEETINYINESLLDILNNLKKMNEANKKLFDNWDKPKKADYPGQLSNT